MNLNQSDRIDGKSNYLRLITSIVNYLTISVSEYSAWFDWPPPWDNIYFTLLYFTLLYFTLLYFTLLYFTLLYFTLLYFTLLYFTLLYFALLCFALLYFTLLYFTLLYGEVNLESFQCKNCILLHVYAWLNIYDSYKYKYYQ